MLAECMLAASLRQPMNKILPHSSPMRLQPLAAPLPGQVCCRHGLLCDVVCSAVVWAPCGCFNKWFLFCSSQCRHVTSVVVQFNQLHPNSIFCIACLAVCSYL